MEATHFWPLQQAYTHPTLLWPHLQLAIFFTMIMPTAILRVKKKKKNSKKINAYLSYREPQAYKQSLKDLALLS
tara:strand:+ start:170 stop:391 length:222 start_codon:yes stop_codon:yes gene_type:complete